MVNVDSYSAIITKVSNALECVIAPYYYYYYYFTPLLSSQRMKKITLGNTEKYKNQA